jgi:hypothetical protein
MQYFPKGVPSVSTQSVVTASRALGTVYQNLTGKPMFVSVTVSATAAGVSAYAYTDANAAPSTLVQDVVTSVAGYHVFLFFIVLPGNYYKVTVGGTPTLQIWTEWY